MATTNHDNDAVARIICERRAFGGQRFEEGSFVAIADGRVIGVGKSFEKADACLATAGIESGEGMVCEVTEPVIDVIRREQCRCP